MSQIELGIRSFLGRHPEIERCQQEGLVNRRALARYLIANGVGGPDDLDAVVASLRRYDFREFREEEPTLFPEVRVTVKDRIMIIDFEKEKALLHDLQRIIGQFEYDRGDTLKFVVGTASIKLFVDQGKEPVVRSLLTRYKVRRRLDRLSEISMMFPDAATETRGVLAVLTRELALNDVVLAELLTASPELLIYVRDEQVAKAYEIVRRLQGSSTSPEASTRRSSSRARSERRTRRPVRPTRNVGPPAGLEGRQPRASGVA
jgi:hypothetical protein